MSIGKNGGGGEGGGGVTYLNDEIHWTYTEVGSLKLKLFFIFGDPKFISYLLPPPLGPLGFYIFLCQKCFALQKRIFIVVRMH